MNPDVNDVLKEYKLQEPKNHKEQRKLLKEQGWYYMIVYDFDVFDDWEVYKVFKSGKARLHDKSSNYDTKEVKE